MALGGQRQAAHYLIDTLAALSGRSEAGGRAAGWCRSDRQLVVPEEAPVDPAPATRVAPLGGFSLERDGGRCPQPVEDLAGERSA